MFGILLVSNATEGLNHQQGAAANQWKEEVYPTLENFKKQKQLQEDLRGKESVIINLMSFKMLVPK